MATMTRADLNNMLAAANLNDPVDRRVMADALEDGGREAEANLLRSLKDSQRVDIVLGEVVHVAIRVEMSDCVGDVRLDIDGDRIAAIGRDTFRWNMFNWIHSWRPGKDEKAVEAHIRRVYHGEDGEHNLETEFSLKVSLVPIAEAFRH